MSKPVVSIITPTYNHERYIGQCIESVVLQTYSNWELIIVDDGSTDGTPDIIKKYKDPRIKYIRQDNLGIMNLKQTYNKALSLSRGEFIAILEGDDCWPIDKLERQLPSFDLPEVILSWGNARIIDEKGKTIKHIKHTEFIENTYTILKLSVNELMSKMLAVNILTPTVTVMIRKKNLIDIGGFQQPEGVPVVDFPTWLPLIFKGKFIYTNCECGIWRQHSQQTSARLYTSMLRGHYKTINEFLESLPTECKLQHNLNNLPLSIYYLWSEGLAMLSEKKWKEARKRFLGIIFTANFGKMKAKATIALLNSIFHIDWKMNTHVKNKLLYAYDLIKNK